MHTHPSAATRSGGEPALRGNWGPHNQQGPSNALWPRCHARHQSIWTVWPSLLQYSRACSPRTPTSAWYFASCLFFLSFFHIDCRWLHRGTPRSTWRGPGFIRETAGAPHPFPNQHHYMWCINKTQACSYPHPPLLILLPPTNLKVVSIPNQQTQHPFHWCAWCNVSPSTHSGGN